MIGGLGIPASALGALQQRLAATAGNVANVNTGGHRRERVDLGEAPNRAGVTARSASIDVSQGPLVSTGEPLDLAIAGDGWFQVRTPNGQTALTRAGNFHLDANGRLTTASGLSVEGDVQVPSGTDPATLAVGEDGSVTASGRPVGKIALASVPVPSELVPLGGGLYGPSAGSGPVGPATNSTVHQGTLEQPNGDLVTDMTDLMVTGDLFTANAAVLRTQDETLQSVLDIKR